MNRIGNSKTLNNPEEQKTERYLSSNYRSSRYQSSEQISHNKHLKKGLGKKAISPYVSWILIMAFVVAISAFMYSFMTGYTKDTTKDIKKQVYNADECRSVSLNILSACHASGYLNITVQNTNYLRITGMDFRLYDKNKKPIQTNTTEIPMNPNRIKELSINTGITTTVSRVDVIPRIKKDNLEIICGEQKAQKEVTTC